MNQRVQNPEQYHFVSVTTIRDEYLKFDGNPLSDMYEIVRRGRQARRPGLYIVCGVSIHSVEDAAKLTKLLRHLI